VRGHCVAAYAFCMASNGNHFALLQMLMDRKLLKFFTGDLLE